MQAPVSRCGNGLDVRLAKELAAGAGISKGGRVEMTLDADGLRLRVERPVCRPGEILCSHVRSIDTLARPVRALGAPLPVSTLAGMRAKLAALAGWTG